MPKLLTLRVLQHPDAGNAQPIVAQFGEDGGLIGRADTARLVLPDPKRTVSRFHAHVSFEDGQFMLEDMGSTNPAVLNNTPLASGQKAPIRSGDRLRIGSYVIGAEVSEGRIAPGALQPPAESPGASDEIYAHTRIVSRESMAAAATSAAGARAPASVEELWRAFQEGAETVIDIPHGLRPEYMRMLGSMMRSLVGGVRRLMQLRTLVKQDMDADTTQLKARQNNPLKFAPDDGRALAALLKPPMPGFMAGPAAIEEVMSDLQVHTIATRVAMRTAVERVLARFEPAALESRLESGGMLSKLLPGGRKARLWDLYLEQQRAIRSDAAEGFQAAFAQAFAEAYERESGRLRQGTMSRAHAASEAPR